jgi:hypothetical protein
MRDVYDHRGAADQGEGAHSLAGAKSAFSGSSLRASSVRLASAKPVAATASTITADQHRATKQYPAKASTELLDSTDALGPVRARIDKVESFASQGGHRTHLSSWLCTCRTCSTRATTLSSRTTSRLTSPGTLWMLRCVARPSHTRWFAQPVAMLAGRVHAWGIGCSPATLRFTKWGEREDVPPESTCR